MEPAGAVVSLFVVAYLVSAPVVPSAITTGMAVYLLLGLALGWAGLRRLDRSGRLLLLGFGLYVASALVSLVNNADWSGAGARFERYLPFLFAPLLLGLLLRNPRRLLVALLTGLSLSSLVMAGFAAYQQLFLGLERVGEGTGLNPNAFGHIAFTNAVLLAALALFAGYGARVKALASLALLCAVYAGIASGSRTALAGFVAGFVTLLLVALERRGTLSVKRILLVGAAALLCLLALSRIPLWQTQMSNLVSHTAGYLQGDTGYNAVSQRLVLWESAWKTWRENPVIGTGLGDSEGDFEALQRSGELPAGRFHSMHVLHNIFLDVLATTGLLGLAAMVAGIFLIPSTLFRRWARQGEDPTGFALGLAGIGLLVLNLVHGLGHSWLFVRSLYYAFFLLLILVALLQDTRSGDRAVEAGREKRGGR